MHINWANSNLDLLLKQKIFLTLGEKEVDCSSQAICHLFAEFLSAGSQDCKMMRRDTTLEILLD